MSVRSQGRETRKAGGSDCLRDSATQQEEEVMEIEFTLHVTVKGRSLQEIDDGLVTAAGQRLVARLACSTEDRGSFKRTCDRASAATEAI